MSPYSAAPREVNTEGDATASGGGGPKTDSKAQPCVFTVGLLDISPLTVKTYMRADENDASAK